MRGKVKRRTFPVAVALVTVVLSALAFFGELGWHIDVLANFRFQALLGCVALFFVVVVARAWIAALFMAAALALNAYALLSVPIAAKPQPGATVLRIVAFNLEGNDRPIDDVVEWLRQEKFDVVSFEELTVRFATQLETLSDIYPYRIVEPRRGGFGIGILSRHPLAEQEILFPAGQTFPVARVVVTIDSRSIEIVAVHPPPPLGTQMAQSHDALLAALATQLPANPHRIVMGDFNAAPTSYALRRLMATLELGKASVAPRLTWPTDKIWPLRIPIDHVLVGKGLALASVENGPAFGSDHFSQIALVTVGAGK